MSTAAGTPPVPSADIGATARSVARIAGELATMAPQELDGRLAEFLGELGQACGADRMSLCRPTPGGRNVGVVHEWSEPGLPTARTGLAGTPLSAFGWWLARLAPDQPAPATTIAGLPSAATAERGFLEARVSHALALVSVSGPGADRDLLLLEFVQPDRAWAPELAPLLQLAGAAIAQALERHRLTAGLSLARTVFDHVREGVFVTDSHGRIVSVNPAFTRITGYDPAEATGHTGKLLASGLQDRHVDAAMWASIRAGRPWQGEVWKRRKDGSLFLADAAVTAVDALDGSGLRYVCAFSDVTALREQQLRLDRLAHVDALTHLPNRALLSDRLEQALSASRDNGTRVAICVLDLDRFKSVNDTLGRETGDRILVEVARRLQATVRSIDTVARLGGDVFAVLVKDLSSDDEIEQILELLRVATSHGLGLATGVDLGLTASIGVRIVGPEDRDPDALLRQAEHALYSAKRDARGSAVRFNPEHDRRIAARREQASAVAAALQQGHMVLHYQPIVELRSGQVRSVEALIRWQRPGHRPLPPAHWLGAIEDDPVMLELDAWVLRAALADCAGWARRGVVLGVNVNVSARWLHDPGFPAAVRHALDAHPDVSPGRLKFEVVESAALADIAAVSSTMEACTAFGVEFALDDFGTGYSTLTYLKTLPASALKIDRSFIEHMIEDDQAQSIVRGVIGLASGSGRKVVAEGVERDAQALRLTDLGCDFAQGYLYSPPQPAEVMLEWLRSRQDG